MVNLQSSVTAPSEMESADSAEPLAITPEFQPEQIDGNAIHQTVLKLTTPLELISAVSQPSDRSVAAMQRLIDVIEELRSPNSGWSADIPQTPETIAPYVTEEAIDCLEAFDPDQALPAQEDQPWQGYFSMKDLNTWLLWCISRSAYEVMGLLEGTAAKIHVAEEGWRSGFLRLTAILEMETPESDWAIDLVTYQSPATLLDDETLIHTPDHQICHQSTAAADLLTLLVHQIQTTTPELCPFLTGVGIDVLVPRRNWQFGVLKIRLGLEFIVNAEVPPSCPIQPHEKDAVQGQPSIAFTDPAWKEKYETAIAHQHLATLLSQRSSLDLKEEDPAAIELLVQEAFDLVETLKTSLSFSSRNVTQEAIALTALAPRLLWCLSRSDQAVMQLMGGVRANLLQPEQDWTSGTLRLLVSLSVQTPELDWYLDLATGQPPQPSVFPLPSEVIVQSEESQWCQQPQLVEQLSDRILHHIQQATPEIQFLMEGTAIDLFGSDGQTQPGVIRLNAGLEFIPDQTFHVKIS